MGKIFYLMGKSSSGKDTLYKNIRRELPQLETVVLYTTRPMREGEKNGVDYYFIDENKVSDLLAAGKVIEIREYDTIHGIWKYMTVDDGNIDIENKNYLMIGTLESYSKIRKYFGDEVMVPLYIQVEDGERLMRAIRREQVQKEPKYAEMCRRFLADEVDFSEEKLREAGIDKRFNNVSKNKSVKMLVEYIGSKL